MEAVIIATNYKPPPPIIGTKDAPSAVAEEMIYNKTSSEFLKEVLQPADEYEWGFGT